MDRSQHYTYIATAWASYIYGAYAGVMRKRDNVSDEISDIAIIIIDIYQLGTGRCKHEAEPVGVVYL